MATEFLLRYDGLSADDHRIDMRLLGRSLIGAEQAIHNGLWAAIHPELPRGKKRLELAIEVEAPAAACVEIHGLLTGVMGVLPFAHDVATSLGTDYIKHLLSAVLLMHGGRKSDAAQHMDKALEIIAEHIRLSVADRALERDALVKVFQTSQDAFVRVVEASRQQAKDIVAPIGPSAGMLRIGGSSMEDATVIDAAMADAIRSREQLEVGDMEEVLVRFDGLVRHSRAARVELPSEPGHYYPADIRDPQYDTFPNVYSEAFSAGRDLRVMAKLSRRESGELVRLHILDVVA